MIIKKYQQGFAPAIVVLLLLGIGLLVGVFLIQQKTGFFNFAAETPLASEQGDIDWTSPKAIFGQIDATQTAINEVTGNRAFYPQGITVDRYSSPNRVYVWDSGNSRILGFSSLGSCQGGTKANQACTNNLDCPASECKVNDFKKADLILGQPDEFHAACNGDNTKYLKATASSLCNEWYPRTLSPAESQDPNSMAVDRNHNLYTFDKFNHRVLMYTDPFTTDKVADKVWGQANFEDRDCNRGQIDASRASNTLCSNNETGNHLTGDHAGSGVDVTPDGNYLWVADGANNRVLRFPVNSTSADIVLGQSDFTSNDGSSCVSGFQAEQGFIPSANKLCRPKSVRINPQTGQIFVLDWPDVGQLMRVLIYDPPFNASVNGGQTPTEVLLGSTNGKYPFNFNRSIGLEFDPTAPNGFWISDWNNNRTLFFTKTTSGWQPTKVIGQPNLTKTDCGGGDDRCVGSPNPPWTCHACYSGGGVGIDSAGNYYVSDKEQSLVLRNSGPRPNASNEGTDDVGANALMLRSENFFSSTINQVGGKGTTAQNALLLANYANNNDQLIIADQFRILFWNDYKNKSTGSQADGVLFQEDFKTNRDNGGIVRGLDKDNKGRIWATHGSEITMFQGPLTNKQAPTLVIPPEIRLRFGGTLTSGSLIGIDYDDKNDALWVADTDNHRIIRISKPTDPTLRQIDMVLGQPNANSTQGNRGKDSTANGDLTCLTIAPDSFGNVGMVRLDTLGNLYIIDSSHEGWQCSNNRMLEYDAATLTPDPTTNFFADGVKVPKRVYGASDFTSKNDEGNVTPHTPIGMAFNKSNEMIMVVDGYGNNMNERVFWYDNPVPPCTSSCVVPATSVIPLAVSQASDAAFDSEGNAAILDHTWERTLLFLNKGTPKANFTFSPTDLRRSPQTITFTNLSTDPKGRPLTYKWDFGDGTQSTEKNPSHLFKFEVPGTSVGNKDFTVVLTVTNDKGTKATVTKLVTLIPNHLPAVSFTFTTEIKDKDKPKNPPTVVPVYFTAKISDADNDSLTFVWNFGDGKTDSKSLTPLHNYPYKPNNKAGDKYNVTLTVTENRLTQTVVSKQITIKGKQVK